MPLTKDDLQQIKNIVVKPLSEEIGKNRVAIEQNREAISNNYKEIQKRPTSEAVVNMFAKQTQDLGTIMQDIFLASDKIYVSRKEFEELKQTVESLKVKLG